MIVKFTMFWSINFIFITILFFLSCQQSPPKPDSSSDHNMIYLFSDGLDIKAFDAQGRDPLILAKLDGRTDFTPQISIVDDCLFLVSASQGIQAICQEPMQSHSGLKRFIASYQKNQASSVSPNERSGSFFQSANSLGLPKRFWRDQQPSRVTIKNPLNLRRGVSGKMYWVGSYSLALFPAQGGASLIKNIQSPSWQPIKIGRNFHQAIADVLEIRQSDGDYLIMASPYNGLQKASLSQQDSIWQSGPWRRIGRGLPSEQYVPGLYFFESIHSLALCNGQIYAALGFEQGLWYSRNNGDSFEQIQDEKLKKQDLRQLQCAKNDLDLYIGGVQFAAIMDTQNNAIRSQLYPNQTPPSLVSKLESPAYSIETQAKLWLLLPMENIALAVTAAARPFYDIKTENIRGVFQPAHLVKGAGLGRRLDGFRQVGLNALVVDFKDDHGNLVYDSAVAKAKKIGAIRKVFDPQSLAEQLHNREMKLIARIVVFKDKQLFGYAKNKYALADKRGNFPWQAGREFWVDPYNDEVWEYNIAIAKELEDLGIDEIQFDYIRFPSDGPTRWIDSKYRPDDDSLRSEALYDFLARANSRLRIPVGIDIYGFNAWYHAGAIIGQDAPLLSRQVQVISPMYYPSHFGDSWFMDGPRSSRSYRILYTGTQRAKRLVRPGTTIRPYLQGFFYKSPTYGKNYILNQIQGVYDARSTSYLFWNMSGQYAKLLNALGDYDHESYRPQ